MPTRAQTVVRLGALLLAAGATSAAVGQGSPATSRSEQAPVELLLPPVGLRARDVALVINDADAASRAIGAYYASRRGIAPDHVVHVSFAGEQAAMTLADFRRIEAEVRARLPADVQAFALAWTQPYRVECMSVTSAFAFGFDPAFCAEGCEPTKVSPYFNTQGSSPYTDHHLRPAMLLAGIDADGVRRLIDRGLRSDERWPAGTAYLVSTGDHKRNVRAEGYPRTRLVLGAAYPIQQVESDALENKPDVMFYFTGVQRVAAMRSNRFLDGAIADDLTSFGGVLSGSSQTSALEWLAAGATGSYGTTSEPCNFRAKFPEPAVVMAHYLSGETLLEAYWKSVLMPGQGVFVGDPLARPFGGVRITRSDTGITIETRSLEPGLYVLQAAQSSVGPFRPIAELVVRDFGVQKMTVPAGEHQFLRLLRADHSR